MLGRLLTWLVERAGRSPRATVLAHALLLVGLATLAWGDLRGEGPARGLDELARAVFDNSLEQVWGQTPELERYEAFKERFGSDELLVVAVSGPGDLDGPALVRLAGLVTALRARPEGLRVTWAGDLPYVPEALVFGETPDEAAMADFRARLDRDPSADRLLRLGEGWDAALLVALPAEGIDDVRRLALAEAAQQTWEQAAPPEWEIDAVGSPVLLGELRATTLSTMARVLPLVNLLILAICLAVFRRPRVVAVALGALLQGEALALLLFFASGHRFDYVSAYLLTCVIVVGFATNMHLYVRYGKERRARPAVEAIREASVVVARPATVSVGTSCLAFLSLTTAEQAAIARFGLFSAIGMLLVLLTAYTLGPALLALLDREDHPSQQRPLRVPDPTRLAMACWRRPWPVLAAAAVLMAVGLVGMDRLLIGSDVRESFKADHRVTRAMNFVVERFPGTSPFELSVAWPPGEGPVTGSALLAEADRLERALLAGLPPVSGRALTEADLVSAADLGRSFCLAPGKEALCEGGLPRPETADALAEELPERGGPPAFARDERGTALRLTLLVDLPNARDGVALAERMREIAAAEAGSGATVAVTGLAPLWSRLEAGIVDDLMDSFAQGAVVLLALVVLSVRGLRAFLVVLVLYAFPLAVVTGLAGFLSAATGYHVNSAVMMYVTVAEGIVVDDVVYFVLGFLHHRRLLPTATGAMRAAVEEVGDGVVLTAFCLSSGFLLMLLGDITNAQLMGGLTAAAVAVALVGVLCVLPALARLLLCPRGEDVHAAEG